MKIEYKNHSIQNIDYQTLKTCWFLLVEERPKGRRGTHRFSTTFEEFLVEENRECLENKTKTEERRKEKRNDCKDLRSMPMIRNDRDEATGTIKK
ncbi:hypothetical protein [Bacteroides sp.]